MIKSIVERFCRVLSRGVMLLVLSFKGVTWLLYEEETVGGEERKLGRYCGPGKR